MPSPSSSAQQALRALGQRLREFRQDARLTGVQLGRLAGWHHSKVSRIERGRQSPSVNDIQAWCEHCGVPDQIPEFMASLRAVEGMFVEWRRMERTGLRLAQEAVTPLWERTQQFRIYNPRLIPGPVQTAEYITALLTGLRVRRDLPNDVEAAVRVRVERQRVLREGNHRFAVVLEEHVLRSPIGGSQTMLEQLAHLLVVGGLPSVSLGVIPLGVDRSTMWAVEGFWMFDDDQVAVELVSGYLTITQPHEIGLYAKAFMKLSALAVYGAEARRVITEAIHALGDPVTSCTRPHNR